MMKTRFSPASSVTRSCLLAFLAASALIHTLSFEATGQVVDDFTQAGESDTWQGRAEGGWASGWKSSGTGGVPGQIAEIAIKSDAALKPESGPYLDVSVASEGTNKRWNIRRAYAEDGNLSCSTPHEISFLFRLDTVPGGPLSPNFGKMSFSDWNSQGSPLGPSKENTTWVIQSTRESAAPQWVLGTGGGFDEGGNLVDAKESGVFLNLGDVYDFSISVDPAANRYRVTITNLNYREGNRGTASFTSDWVDFESKEGRVGGCLLILEHKRRGEGIVAFSMDSVRIAAEPAVPANQ